MKFKIEHREELVGYFEVEAEDESTAMDVYQEMVSKGVIDYGDMEMVDSSDELVRPEFEVGQECFWAYDKVHPEDRCFIITSIRRRYGNGEDGNIKAWVEFDAIRHDGTVIHNEVLSPDRIWRTGRTFQCLVFAEDFNPMVVVHKGVTTNVWIIKIPTNK